MINNFRKNVKVSKDVGWLIPGLNIKRWLFLIFLGSILMVLGFLIIFDIRPIYQTMELIRKAALILPTEILAVVVIIIGALIFFSGWKKTTLSIMDMDSPRSRNSLLEKLYRRSKLNKGAKVVAIGGGTGLSMLLKGIKKYTNNITAVVTVGDDGGSSGRLREDMGILPPGDIRNCIAALADDDSLITELFQYRFKKGTGLEGHSFGNLFLSVLCEITGDMFNAVKESSKVLNIRGRVLPSTLDDMRLVAQMEDGRIIQGESNIPEAGGRIKRLFCEPENPKALKEVIDAIKSADIILMGPGSLYTSVIPNLLIDEIALTISKSKAHKAYVCNVMTQPGETDGYTVSDHVKAILKHAKYENIIDTVFINNELPENLTEKYEQAGSYPVKYDKEEIKKLKLKVIGRKLIEEDKEGFVRHSYMRLARLVYMWYKYHYDNKKVNAKAKKRGL